MDEMIVKFKKNDKACFCAAAFVLSNVLSIFTTAAGFQQLLQSLGVGLLLSIVTQAFKLLCEWQVAQGPGTASAGRSKAAKVKVGYAAVLLGYILALVFSIFFSEVQFLSYGYPTAKWDAIAEAAVAKGYSQQLQALADEADTQKAQLQSDIAAELDTIEDRVGAQSAEAALTQQQADAMMAKYTVVYAEDGTTVLFDPEGDHWAARLRSAAAAMAAGQEASGLDSYLTELEGDLSQLDTQMEEVMQQIAAANPSIRSSRSNSNTKEAMDAMINATATAHTAVSQQLLARLQTLNAKHSQYARIQSDLETLRDAQSRAQNDPAAQLAAAKKACRKALLTDPEALADSTQAFVTAAAELSTLQTQTYSSLRIQAESYAALSQLESYCARAKAAEHPDWSAAVEELRDKAAQLPADSAQRKPILWKLDALRATYLTQLNPLERCVALLIRVPWEYRLASYGCLLVAVLVDALSLIANLSWPREDRETA